jgi:hypothetical protein
VSEDTVTLRICLICIVFHLVLHFEECCCYCELLVEFYFLENFMEFFLNVFYLLPQSKEILLNLSMKCCNLSIVNSQYVLPC